MCYAKGGHFPPTEWTHDPKLSNTDKNTVAMLLA